MQPIRRDSMNGVARVKRLGPAPGDADASQRLISQLGECRRRKVEVINRTARASVCDLHRDRLATIGSGDLLVADRVGVGVHAIVARVDVEQQVRDSSNVIGIGVCFTTCAKTSLVECSLSALSASQEAV